MLLFNNMSTAENPFLSAEPGEELDPIAAHLYEHYDQVVEAETAWNALDTLSRKTASEDFQEMLIDLDIALRTPHLSREDYAPKALKSIRRDVQERVRACVTTGQAAAVVSLWGHNPAVSAFERNRHRNESRVMFYEYIASRVPDDAPSDGIQTAMAELNGNIMDTFYAAYEADEALLEPLEKILSGDAILIEKLIDFLEDHRDDGNFEGLFKALARTHFDPKSYSFFDGCMDAIESTPESYIDIYVDELKQRLDEAEEELPEGLQVVKLLAQLAVSASVPDDKLAELLKEVVSFEDYPLPLKQDMKKQLDAYKAQLKDRLESLLVPHKLPRRFVPDLQRQATTPAGNKPGSKRNRKVVSKRVQKPYVTNQPAYVAEAEKENKGIGVVYIGRKVGNKFVRTPLQIAETDDSTDTPTTELLIEALLDTRDVKDYLRQYSSREDIKTMLGDIFENPRRNGVAPMNGVTAKVEFGVNGRTQIKTFPVLRYSPKQANNSNTLTAQQSTRTRILFTTFKNEEGENSLLFLLIGHKSKLEHLVGGMHGDKL